MHHTSTAFYPAHAPEQWATGGELMTTNQRAALDSAAAHVGIDIPFLQPEDANGQRVTKSEASPLSPICGKVRGPRTSTSTRWVAIPVRYVTSIRCVCDIHLLFSSQYTLPPHSTEWVHRHECPTRHQLAWLDRLINAMGIPQAVKADVLEKISFGQASLLISRLREEKKNVRSSAEEKRMAFQDAVGSVRRELPAPGED
ncbi:hypothetical protein C8Q70DRAFT_1033533 [Cubamyces menziesii]|nr:hypothetical protein C8Q70DRAFT_1033533 [Cubamyces menziesii]